MTGPAVPSGLEALLAEATPGPWVRANALGLYADGPAIKNAEDFDWVATVQVSNAPNWRENARLIALAPDAVRLLVDMAAHMAEDVCAENPCEPLCEGCRPFNELLARFAALDQKAGTA